MNKNKESTRYYSDKQEQYISKLLGGQKTANSGAGKWSKGDVIVKDAGISIECKTTLKEKSSVTVKKEWLDKQRRESWEDRMSNSAIAISFTPEGDKNYFVIDEKLMKFLVEKLKEENE